MLLLISGDRRTGKDTLARQLRGDRISLTGWRIYAAKNPGEEFQQLAWQRVALADEVKRQVHNQLQITSDENKDTRLINGRTLRSYYIETGMSRRIEDPDYWCQQLLSKVDPTGYYCLTDWRFENERAFFHRQGYNFCFTKQKSNSGLAPEFNIQTIRVFRREIEPVEDVSERSLDEVTADYVLVPVGDAEKQFAALLLRFPQYHHYRPFSVIG